MPKINNTAKDFLNQQFMVTLQSNKPFGFPPLPQLKHSILNLNDLLLHMYPPCKNIMLTWFLDVELQININIANKISWGHRIAHLPVFFSPTTGVFPFRFRRQPLSFPSTKSQCIIPTNVYNRVVPSATQKIA